MRTKVPRQRAGTAALKNRPRGAASGGPWPIWALWLGLCALTIVAYAPSWHGQPLWDDNGHLTRPDLRSFLGLWRIWFDPRATQQYYPVVHSAFWLFHRLWGDHTLGYHLVNVVLHSTSACLFAVLLRRFSIPGATAAAVVFALHPVHAESVAWMSELKNVMSGVWYLAAALLYVQFDRDRHKLYYWLAFWSFVLALLSKSVTATLPAALLVVLWWRRGTLSMKGDVVPLLPFLAIGVMSGLFTAWVERNLIGAVGPEYALPFIERILIAGRVVWFYLWTLVWPVNLAFIYPRWAPMASTWWAYLFPVAAAAVVGACWWIRSRTRAPLAAALLFVGTLFPALGFIDVYPFRYSFVANHFQYLATLPIIAIACAWVWQLIGASPQAARRQTAAVAIIAAVLGGRTWQVSHAFVDSDTLYRETIAVNPACWMCHNNLAVPRLFGSAGQVAEAESHLRQAIRLNPQSAEAHNNLGNALQRQGRLDEALRSHEQALRLDPVDPDIHYDTGLTYQVAGQLDVAAARYTEALRLQPLMAKAHHNLGLVRQQQGALDAAISHFRDAIRLAPEVGQFRESLDLALRAEGGNAAAHPASRDALRWAPGLPTNLAMAARAAIDAGRHEEAVSYFRAALKLDPTSIEAQTDLAAGLAAAGDLTEAADVARAVIRQEPASSRARNILGYVLLLADKPAAAMAELSEAVRLEPSDAGAHHRLGLAAVGAGDLPRAVRAFEAAVKLTPADAEFRNDFGKGLVRVGRLDDARREFAEALRLDPSFDDARANLDRITGLSPR